MIDAFRPRIPLQFMIYSKLIGLSVRVKVIGIPVKLLIGFVHFLFNSEEVPKHAFDSRTDLLKG